MLMVYITLLVAFVGLALPYLMRKDFTNEVARQFVEFDKALAAREESFKKFVDSRVGDELQKLEKSLMEQTAGIRESITEEIAFARANGYMTDADVSVSQGYRLIAIVPYLGAAAAYLIAKHDGNVRWAIERMFEESFAHVTAEEICTDHERTERITKFVKELEVRNKESRYDDLIERLNSWRNHCKASPK